VPERDGALTSLSPPGLSRPPLDGPSAADLLLELDWLLSDAVGGWRDGAGGVGGGEDGWRRLRRSSALAAPATTVALRAPLAQLDQLWHARRVAAREPLQYVLGACHWHDLPSPLAVGPGVLVPRPETGELLELARAALAAAPRLGRAEWADCCCGSGALALGLVAPRGPLPPSAPPVHALDTSPVALAYTRRNAERLHLAPRLQLWSGDLLEPLLAARGAGCLGGLLSNPPYIPPARLDGGQMQPEVGLHEPRLALDGGGADGAHLLRRLVAQAALALAPGGFMALETDGEEQAGAVGRVAEEAGFERVALAADLAGIRRFITAWRA